MLPCLPVGDLHNRTHCEQWFDGGEYSCPPLSVAPAVGDWHEGGQILTFSTSWLDAFQAPGKQSAVLHKRRDGFFPFLIQLLTYVLFTKLVMILLLFLTY